MKDKPKSVNPQFTVFTPCFNSSRVIHRVWDSLRAQTFRDFEWLVVDDGSTDDTLDIIREYAARSAFPIHILEHGDNRGLPAAYNTAVSVARGNLFIAAGHDDGFLPDTLDRFAQIWNDIPRNQRSRYRGVVCRCRDQHGRPIGPPIAEPYIDGHSPEVLRDIPGEKWGFNRTDVMREYPMNEAIDKYVKESLIWRPMGLKYLARHINDEYRIYYVTEPGSIVTSRRVRFPRGSAYSIIEELNAGLRPERLSLSNAIRIYGNLARHLFHARAGIRWGKAKLTHPMDRRRLVVCTPIGVARIALDVTLRRVDANRRVGRW